MVYKINPEVVERLETEIERIKTRYDPKTTEELEKVEEVATEYLQKSKQN